jgi:pimeloyl-ACP methyl ester carboxylesterase
MMRSAVFPRRGDPDTWYPAGVAGAVARWVTLADGERVRVVEHSAAGGSANSLTALLLHGWGCNAFHFRRLGPDLAQRGVSSVAVDLRGHGLSYKPTEAAAYTSVAMADFTQRLLDALGLERVGLLGHSLGGALALDTAAAAPARVGWLMLLNPVGLSRLTFAPLFTRVPVRVAERLPAFASRAVAAAALYLAYGRLARPERGDLEQYLFPTLVAGGRRGIFAFANAYSWDPRSPRVLERIGCPTHVMLGERDRVIRQHEVAALVRSITGARVDIVSGAGHVLAEEVSPLVADAVAELASAASLPNDVTPAPGARR